MYYYYNINNINYKDMKTIVLANFKGGVGKSTTVQNVAAALALRGYNVLMGDLDPQCNLTMACGMIDNYDYGTIESAFSGTNAKPIEIKKNLSLLRGNISLAVSDMQYGGIMRREHVLERYIKQQKYAHEFDFLVLDCPPYLGLLTQNALVVGDYIFVPIDCEYFSSYGLNFFRQFLNQNNYEIDGVICTKQDKRLTLHKDFVDTLRESYGELVFKTAIPKNVSISEAQAMGNDIFGYAKGSLGASAYSRLTNEIEKLIL